MSAVCKSVLLWLVTLLIPSTFVNELLNVFKVCILILLPFTNWNVTLSC
jgi:hypothetical protein